MSSLEQDEGAFILVFSRGTHTVLGAHRTLLNNMLNEGTPANSSSRVS